MTSKDVRGLALFLAAITAAMPGWALAKAQPSCRDLLFAGAAGAASNDKVTLRVVDKDGNTLDESCEVQVHNNETARAFAARLTGAWGDGTGVTCTEPAPLPTKSCGNGGAGRSCSHKFKFKADNSTVDPDDGLIRVRVCCRELVDCKGAKLLNTPISVQSKLAPAVVFGPTVPPVVGIEISTVSVDPIAMLQKPHAALQTCRKALGGVVGAFAPVLVDSLARCRSSFAGAGSNCLGDPKFATSVLKLQDALGTTVTGSCEPSGVPGAFGYHTCPAPCALLPATTWQEEAACLACVTQTSIVDAVTVAYGPEGLPPPPTPEAQQCQDTVGKGLVQVIGTNLREIIKCQQGADAGKAATPGGVHCRDADVKGKRAAIATKTRDAIIGACTDMNGLVSCASDPSGEATCIVDGVAGAATRAVAEALYPESVGSPSGAFVQ